MKTFEQFRAWMKDNHLWNEYLYEFHAHNKKDPKIYLSSFYESQTSNVILRSFNWVSTAGGYGFWKSVDKNGENILKKIQ